MLAFYLITAQYHLKTDQIELADRYIYFLEVSGANPNRQNIKTLRQNVDILMNMKKLMRSVKKAEESNNL